MSPKTRTAFSAVAAFGFYFGWTWWVNHTASDDTGLVLRSALVQGSYSAFMTATFTGFLDWALRKMRCRRRPYLAVIAALAVQSTAVLLINICNGTPRLWATVAPSILFSAIYGFVYAYGLRRTADYQCPDSDSPS